MKRGRRQSRTPNESSPATEKTVPQQRAAAGDDPGPRAVPPFSQAQLGEDLRAARKKAGLTLQALSRSSGYSVTHLCQVELGYACPTIGALARITRALGLTAPLTTAGVPVRARPDRHLVRQPVASAGTTSPQFLCSNLLQYATLRSLEKQYPKRR